jgi:hypothetical protein
VDSNIAFGSAAIRGPGKDIVQNSYPEPAILMQQQMCRRPKILRAARSGIVKKTETCLVGKRSSHAQIRIFLWLEL